MLRPPPAGTIAPTLIGRSSSARVMCVPRLGRMRGTSSSSWSSSGRIWSAHTPVALITFVARISNSPPPRVSVQRTPAARPSSVSSSSTRQRFAQDGAEALRLAEDGQHEPHVVGLAVVEEVGGGRVARRERRQQLLHLVALDDAVLLGAPVLLVHERVAAAAPGALQLARHAVVHVQADAEHPVGALPLEARHEHRQRPDEVRRELDQDRALEQGLADQAEIEVLEVAKAAVHELRRAARCARREVLALDQSDAVAAGRRVEGDAGAGDPSADHDQVVLVLGERLERVLAADHGRYVTNSAGSGRAGGGCSCRLGPRWIRPRKRSFSSSPTAAQPTAVRRTPGRAPVIREAALVSTQQHDVDRARRSAEVLLVLLGVAGLDHAGDHQRGRAVQLAGRLPVRALLQPRRAPPGRGPGTATGTSGGGSGPSGRARTARRASRAKPARRRTPCACAACGLRRQGSSRAP